MIRVAGLVFSVFCLLMIVGCSQYDSDYQYTPRPITADIPATQPQQPPPVSTMVSVIGVRYGDDENHIPSSVEVRLRMDNNSPETVVFNPMTMEMTNAQLVRLAQPIVRPPTSINIGPSQSAYLTAYFPFPNGSSYDTLDLNTLQMRWQLQIGSRVVGQVVNFTRVWSSYYGPSPYWYYGPPPPPFFYGGVVVVHRRW
jgi:hypothetical protein